jgi:hypothetical protein
VPADLVANVLAIVPGIPVRRAERPISHLVSPDVLTGVDCNLPARNGARVRSVGTTVARVAITGGHVVQGSAFAEVRRSPVGRRLNWSHYLAQPGVVETLNKVAPEHLAGSFLTAGNGSDLLDLGAIGARAMDKVQANERLDHNPALRSTRTKLRWAVELQVGAPQHITFTIHGDTMRTARLRVANASPHALAALCEDLALHDWLLTTLVREVDRARIGSAPCATVVRRLRPTVDHLLHLWMPAARLDPTLADLWDALDHTPGFTRQWNANVNRVRDQLAIAVIEALGNQRVN